MPSESSEEKARPHCSFCESTNVKKMSSFGTAQLVRQYYCNDCRSVFEFIRWQEEETVDERSDEQ